MKKETTKKERIINGVLIAAGIGVTTCLGIEVIKHVKLTKIIKEQDIQIKALGDKLTHLEKVAQFNEECMDVVKEAITEVYGNEE